MLLVSKTVSCARVLKTNKINIGNISSRFGDVASGLTSKTQAPSIIVLENKCDTHNPDTWEFKEELLPKIHMYNTQNLSSSDENMQKRNVRVQIFNILYRGTEQLAFERWPLRGPWTKTEILAASLQLLVYWPPLGSHTTWSVSIRLCPIVSGVWNSIWNRTFHGVHHRMGKCDWSTASQVTISYILLDTT